MSVGISGKPNAVEEVTSGGDFSMVSSDEFVERWSCSGVRIQNYTQEEDERGRKRNRKSSRKFLEEKERSLGREIQRL